MEEDNIEKRIESCNEELKNYKIIIAPAKIKFEELKNKIENQTQFEVRKRVYGFDLISKWSGNIEPPVVIENSKLTYIEEVPHTKDFIFLFEMWLAGTEIIM